jgi:ABC-type transport system involved in cytochrome c biogenesis permease subunit
MKTIERYLPWAVVGLVAIYFATNLFPQSVSEGQMNIHSLMGGTVQENGRYQPLDSSARNQLMALNHQQTITYTEEKNPDTKIKITADRWLLDLMAVGLSSHYSWAYIDDPEVVSELQLKPRRGNRYHKSELRPHFETILEKAIGVSKKDKKDLTRKDYQWVLLAINVKERFSKAYDMERGLSKQGINPDVIPLFKIENIDLIALLGLKARPDLHYHYSFEEITGNRQHPEYWEQFKEKVRQLSLARESGDKNEDLVDNKTMELAHKLKNYNELAQLGGNAGLIPVEGGKWLSLGDALDQMENNGQEIPEAVTLSKIIYAYAVSDPATFNKEVASYRQMLSQQYPTETKKSGTEQFFNDFSPFYLCMVFYIGVLLLTCLAWIGWTETLHRTAFSLAVLLVLVHTWALCTRMYIMGRPPVTNLYSSAVFIGWGCVLLCLGLEWIFHNGFGLLVASILGFLSLFVAMHLDGGDTLEVLVAVLDTNFWLATHVVCVTMGYTATLVAGFLGIAYIFFGLCTPKLDKGASKMLANAVYGVVCFATLLSFVGTVLGGIWADQSWGRFWGWDPKENGAVMIVIWNALILHCRWAGLIKERGLAVLAVAGNIVVAWSYFGTNQLGVGLHNYGFNKNLAFWLVVFWASQVLCIIAGCLPLRYWWSFNSRPAIPAKLPKVDTSKIGRRLRPA